MSTDECVCPEPYVSSREREQLSHFFTKKHNECVASEEDDITSSSLGEEKIRPGPLLLKLRPLHSSLEDAAAHRQSDSAIIFSQLNFVTCPRAKKWDLPLPGLERVVGASRT